VLREEVLKADVDREAARANVRVAVEAILKLLILLIRTKSAKERTRLCLKESGRNMTRSLKKYSEDYFSDSRL
jgi:hypothetical protein